MASSEASAVLGEQLRRGLADIRASLSDVAFRVELLETDRRELEQRVMALELSQRRY